MKIKNRRVRPAYALVVLGCIAAAVVAYLVTPDRAASSPQADVVATAQSAVDITAKYESPNVVGQGWWQQLPAPVSSLHPPAGATCDQMSSWARARGGVDRGWSDVALSIRARKPVHINVLAVGSHLLTSRTPTQVNTLLCVPSTEPYMDGEYVLEHGMESGFVLDHDGASDDLTSIDGKGYGANLGFGEIAKLSFAAFAHSCDCTWQLAVTFTVDGARRHVLLNDSDNNHPFHTVAAPARPGDPTDNAVWCAPDTPGRLTSPVRRDCPIPVVYETPLY